MGQGYRVGFDGGDYTAPESLELYKCEMGNNFTWYRHDVCCPSELIS